MKKYILYFIITNLFIVYQIFSFETEKKNIITKTTINKIKENRIKYCDKVYLIATRRRDYTKYELIICSKHFKFKREQELNYIYRSYMTR
jgi:hypothetical protein